LLIIFVGLPGSGKTTIGRQMGRRLGLPFLDSDGVIEQRLGCSIREFFDREGEERFRDIEQSVLEDLSKHPEKLKDLLTFHVVPGALAAKDVKNSNVKAVNGDPLALSKAGDFVTVENAMVVKGDVMGSNGVIHIIDTVMTPPKK
jgi:hypothetical protein